MTPATSSTRIQGVAIAAADIQVIDIPTMRLNDAKNVRCCAQTVPRLQPRLLTLHPPVRLHRIDENTAMEMAALFAHLRDIQRRLASSRPASPDRTVRKPSQLPAH